MTPPGKHEIRISKQIQKMKKLKISNKLKSDWSLNFLHIWIYFAYPFVSNLDIRISDFASL